MISKAVELTTGSGGLPLLKISTPRSVAEIYLHGAQVTHFKKAGEPPLLFLSRKSWFAPDKAIRGGVPICFPWFGSRTGEPAHGFARLSEWELADQAVAPDGRVTVRLRLPGKFLKPAWASLRTEFIVTVAETLTMELVATNAATDKTLEIENCLHAYFHVGDIDAVSIMGLQHTMYLDHSASGQGECKTDNDPRLTISKETNRLYLDTAKTVELRDEKFQRTLRVEKSGSQSTVVWNPWTTQKLDDFDPLEYTSMICVEAGNVKQNKIRLAPGQTTSLKAILASAPLK